MEVIRAWCPVCGEVDVPRDAVALFVTARQRKFHTFICPSCREYYTRQTTDEVERALAHANVRAYECPAEARELHEGPALTLDELIDLHSQLENAEELTKFFTTSRKVV